MGVTRRGLGALAPRAWASPPLTTWARCAARSLGFVLVLPVLLRRLPAPEFAVWSLVATVASLQTLAELGFGVTFARSIAYAMGGATALERIQGSNSVAAGAQPNWHLVLRICSTMRFVYGRLSVALALVMVVAGTVAMWRPVHRMANPADGWAAWMCVCLGTVFSFRANQFVCLLQGTNSVALLRRWESLFSLGGILTSLVVLWITPRVAVLLAASQSWVLLGAWRNAWVSRRLLSEREIEGIKPVLHRDILDVVWPSAWRSGIGSAMSFGLVQISAVAYAQSKDLAGINAYLLGLRILQPLSLISQAPFYSKLPAFGAYYARGDSATLLRSAGRGMAHALWAFVLPASIIGIFGERLIALLGSATPFPGAELWILMSAGFLAERVGAMHLQLYSLTNHIVWHVANGLTGCIMCAIWLVLYGKLGVRVFPVGLLAAYCGFYLPFCLRHSSRRFFDGSLRKALGNTWWPIGFFILCAVWKIGITG